MFCKECGKKLEESAKFCPDCGTPTEEQKSVEIQNENLVRKPEGKCPLWKRILAHRKGCVVAGILILIGIIVWNVDTGSADENTDKIDLYEFVDYTEDEVVEKLGFEKNETGFYPSDSSINIICIEGKVYGLEISRAQEEANLLSVCGITIDVSKESVDSVLQDKFEYVTEYPIPEGMCYYYLDRVKKNMLMLECDKEQIITRISYVTDKELIEDTLSCYEGEEEETVAAETGDEVSASVWEEEVKEINLPDINSMEIINGMEFIFWCEGLREVVDVNFVSDTEGFMFVYIEQYDEKYNQANAELEKYFFRKSDGEIYRLYSTEGVDVEGYFTLTYEECPVLRIYDEVSGTESVFLETEWAEGHVG